MLKDELLLKFFDSLLFSELNFKQAVVHEFLGVSHIEELASVFLYIRVDFPVMHLATKVQLLPHDHRQLNLALQDGLLSLLSLELGLVVDVNAIDFADFGD